MGEDPPQQVFVKPARIGDRKAFPVAHQLDEARGELAHRQHEIRHSGRDRAARHRRIFGLDRVLHENDAARLLDRPHPDRAVRAGTGQNDGKAVAVLLRHGAEEQVDRRAVAARLVEFHRGDLVIGDVKRAIRWNDVDVVRLQLLRRRDLHDGHARACRQNGRQVAMALRIEVHHHDEGSAGLFRKRVEKRLQRLDAARGSANADDDRSCAALVGFRRRVHVRALVVTLRHDATPRRPPLQWSRYACGR
jgi:hypothetical protein